MAIDTTKKVTQITVNGTAMQLASSGKIVDKISVQVPSGYSITGTVNGNLKYVTTDDGILIDLGNSGLYFVDANGTQTQLLSTGNFKNFVEVANKIIISRNTSTASETESTYSFDKTTHTLKLLSNSVWAVGSLANLDGVYITNYAFYQYCPSNTYIYDVATDELIDTGVGAIANSYVDKIKDRYILFGNMESGKGTPHCIIEYDTTTHEFTEVYRSSATTGAFRPHLFRQLTDDIWLIGGGYGTSQSGAWAYYTYSTSTVTAGLTQNGISFNEVRELGNGKFLLSNSSYSAGLLLFDTNDGTKTSLAPNGNFVFIAETTDYLIYSLYGATNLLYIDKTNYTTTYYQISERFTSMNQNSSVINGKIYASGSSTAYLGVWELDINTHTLTRLTTTGYYEGFYYTNNRLFAGCNTSGMKGIYEIDTTTGTPTLIYTSTGNYAYNSWIDVTDGYYLVSSSGSNLTVLLFDISNDTFTTIQPASGTATAFSLYPLSTVTSFGDNSIYVDNILKYPEANVDQMHYTGYSTGGNRLIYDKVTHKVLIVGYAVNYANDKALYISSYTISKAEINNGIIITTLLNSSTLYGNGTNFDLDSTNENYTLIKPAYSSSTMQYPRNEAIYKFTHSTGTLEVSEILIDV